jgi:hypothetical protein
MFRGNKAAKYITKQFSCNNRDANVVILLCDHIVYLAQLLRKIAIITKNGRI